MTRWAYAILRPPHSALEGNALNSSGDARKMHTFGSSQVPLRECGAGPGLQVCLKRHSTTLVSKLNGDVDDPGPAGGRIGNSSGIVRIELRRRFDVRPV
jgi:hypothetical protein